MPNAVVVFEADTQQLAYVNPAAESALDLSRKSLEGQSVHNLFGDNEALRVMIGEVKQGHVLAQRQEMILHSLPGQYSSWVNVGTRGCGGPRGPYSNHDGVFPIDQQLRSERDEHVTQQVEANKQLMRNLSHEIKNPLGGICGATRRHIARRM
jgi:two-component system nitrogen regulation sensor histidine kinase GlnL